MITRKQLELFNYIHREVTNSGVAPSFDEMKEALNLKSKSGIHRLISGLEERGFIKKLSHRARAIEILKYPAGFNETKGPSNNVTMIDRKKPFTGTSDNNSAVSEVPMMGRIAAGSPLEAINDFSQNLDVPSYLIGSGDHYALEVKGESMIDAGIRNGDTILVREQKYANNGEIVVALISGQESTLKKFIKNGNEIHLKAGNIDFDDQIYPSSEVQIQGKFVGVHRTY